MNSQPPVPSLRLLEALWWAFLASALAIPVLIGLALTPQAEAPAWAQALFLGGLVASLPPWLVKRHFDERMGQAAFRGLPEGERRRAVQVVMIVGLAISEFPMYAGVAHYLVSGQAIGITILTLISVALMLLFHPSRILRAR
ncbi:MAG TPA: hypothetical protein VFP70_00275 [Burkholderiales bacterium]|nr:hypothetical protein [Burkholderiales bacterium]